MKRYYVLAVLAGLFFVPVLKGEFKKEEGKNMDAILLVAFGTSEPEARKSFVNIERLTKKRFPNHEIRWAYTSDVIRKKMVAKGEKMDSVEEALDKCKAEGVKKIAVQSLHIIPGEEYSGMLKTVEMYNNSFEKIVVSPPLLNSMNDIKKSIGILIGKIPAERKKEDAVIFMGHGSPNHFADVAYAAVAYVFEGKNDNVFLATVEGYPAFEEIVKKIKGKKVKKIYMMPFMSVAGEHARNDMAGDAEDSWKSIFTANGIEAVSVLKGLAEYDEIVDIWLEHLEKTMQNGGSEKQ
jgi:sirohydrochlorin cobaltochelatase